MGSSFVSITDFFGLEYVFAVSDDLLAKSMFSIDL